MSDRTHASTILTIPNVLSLLRLLAFVPAAYFASQATASGNLRAAALLLFMAATDILDGFLARRLNQKSELGRIIDPIVDKICVGGMFVILAWQRQMPWWIAGLVIGRDALILVAGLFMLGRFRRVTESNWIGKAAVTVLVITLLVYLFDIGPLMGPALAASALAVALSGVGYAWRFIRLLRGEEALPPPAEPLATLRSAQAGPLVPTATTKKGN